MIWNIKVWQTCKKKKNQEGGQHFFTPLYLDKFVAVCEEFSGRLIHESLINYYDFYNAHAL